MHVSYYSWNLMDDLVVNIRWFEFITTGKALIMFLNYKIYVCGKVVRCSACATRSLIRCSYHDQLQQRLVQALRSLPVLKKYKYGSISTNAFNHSLFVKQLGSIKLHMMTNTVTDTIIYSRTSR